MAHSDNIYVSRYTEGDAENWDSFIRHGSINHFLFKRAYLEHHRYKYDDFSLIVKSASGGIVAVFPANQKQYDIFSHQYLTFGGIVTRSSATTDEIAEIVRKIMEFCGRLAYKNIFINSAPDFYYSTPMAQNVLPILEIKGVKTEVKLWSVLDLQSYSQSSMRSSKRQAIERASKKGLIVAESNDYSLFIKLLNASLYSRHGGSAVHSAYELERLTTLFPGNIQLVTASDDCKVLAGAVLYLTDLVVHTQYLLNTDCGRNLGALDFLIYTLLEKFKVMGKKHWSFGTSNNPTSGDLNKGLFFWKESFGCRVSTQQSYHLALDVAAVSESVSPGINKRLGVSR